MTIHYRKKANILMIISLSNLFLKCLKALIILIILQNVGKFIWFVQLKNSFLFLKIKNCF